MTLATVSSKKRSTRTPSRPTYWKKASPARGSRFGASPGRREVMYPGVGHDSWTKTYDGSAGHDVYSWMLRFTCEFEDYLALNEQVGLADRAATSANA